MPKNLRLVHQTGEAPNGIAQLRDVYDAQLSELAEIRLPDGHASARERFIKEYRLSLPGSWSHYPWLDLALRTISSDDYYELRTNRNRNLLTSEEQSLLRDASVGIAGLSVGSNIAAALCHVGIGARFVLADHDLVATSNLNRTGARVLDVGCPKVEVAARALLEIDPFIECTLYDEGLDARFVDDFVAASDVVLDELDDFQMKVLLRVGAEKHGKPLVMATNLGDSVLVDIERWDEPDAELSPFNGKLEGLSIGDLMETNLSTEQISRFAAQVVGVDNVPLRALRSLPLIGKDLVGRPQLGTTAWMGAGLAAVAVREILLKRPMASGRYRFAIADALELGDDHGTRDERMLVMAQLQPLRLVSGERPALVPPSIIGASGTQEALTALAAYATLAPSPHNTQPWIFRISDDCLAISADHGRALPVADPAQRALAISLGCAAMSAIVAAAAAGIPVAVRVDPQGVVRLQIDRGPVNAVWASLLPGVLDRVTDKRPYLTEPIDPPAVELPDGVDVFFVNSQELRRELADLHLEAVDALAEQAFFSGELASWLRADPRDPRRDGMTLPMPREMAEAMISALRSSGSPLREMGVRDADAIAAGPVVGLLTTVADDMASWIVAGLAWQELCLLSVTQGLAIAPLTAVIENPHTRARLEAIVPLSGAPQMLFRMGRPVSPLPPSARRDPRVEE